MRIESPQNFTLSPAAQASQSPLTLEQGEVIRATVLSVQGETVSLKTEGGRQFSARLAAGTVLMENDTVELMAGTEREQPVLRVVFVEPGQSGIPVQNNSLAGARAAVTQQLAEAFAQMNLKPTPKLISLAAEILRQYPVDAKTAAFFAANGIQPTQESIGAIQTIVSGKEFGAVLYEVVQDTAAALGQTDAPVNTSVEQAPAPLPADKWNGTLQADALPRDNGAAPQVKVNAPNITTAETGKTQAQLSPAQQQTLPVAEQPEQLISSKAEAKVSPLPVQEQAVSATNAQNTPPQTPGTEIQSSQATPAGIEADSLQEKTEISGQQPQPRPENAAAEKNLQLPPKDEGTQAAPMQPPKEGGKAQAAPMQPQLERQVMQVSYAAKEPADGIVAQAADTAPSAGVIPEEAVPFIETAQGEEKAVFKALLDLFAKTGEDLDAKTLKKSVEETPQKLLELQMLMKNTDIHTQEALSSRFNELTAQAKLAEDVSRFVFVQIPIHLKEYGSAELYIYKRNRRDKGADRQSTSVVLGLSTQNLGRVEAMIRIENREISLDLRVQNEGALASFQEDAPALRQSFAQMRYQLKEYKVAPLREKTTPLNAEERLVKMHTYSGTGLDVMI